MQPQKQSEASVGEKIVQGLETFAEAARAGHWTAEYDPTDPADVARVAEKYNLQLWQAEELDIPCWFAKYTDGTPKNGSSSFFATESEDSERRSRFAAALMCYLWYEKNVEYPLCRELARVYFITVHLSKG